jgi:hypothetical protein
MTSELTLIRVLFLTTTDALRDNSSKTSSGDIIEYHKHLLYTEWFFLSILIVVFHCAGPDGIQLKIAW